ncbi:MAG: hydrogenase maturation protease [Chitinispirillaceae bacterium]|nr:hydrogenase maturation protease [Chitinispirillaceae bacterium]
MSALIAFAGIGNPLAGDDGAGVEAVKRLEKKLTFEQKRNLLFYTITEDLFVISEYLPNAKYFIFLDAFYGESPGKIVMFSDTYKKLQRLSLSFHQTDIVTVMQLLKKLKISEYFPHWEVWGVTISPPSFLTTKLSEKVDKAVDKLVNLLVNNKIYKRKV